MSSLWHNAGGGWSPLQPSGFPDEATLHRMVADAPQLLPLSGQPEVVVLGSEVALGGGYADIVGVEVGGRPVVIEVKLAGNSEARRAVVAQALAYAAVLHGLTIADLEETVLRAHLERRGYASIRAACEAAGTALLPDEDEFTRTLAASLERGHARIVFVLDRAPAELVRLVGYLEAVTEGLVIDLITVAQYRIGDELVVVPQRIDPGRTAREDRERTAAGPTRNGRPTRIRGADAFIEGLAAADPRGRDATMRVVRWARALEAEGVARLYSNAASSTTLLVWLARADGGIVSLAHHDGPRIYVYGQVIDAYAPGMRDRLQQVLGLEEIGHGNVITGVTDEQLSALADAYRVAVGGGEPDTAR